MQHLQLGQGIGFAITLALMAWIGIRSGNKVTSSGDFAVGNHKAGSAIVAGTIMGTLVGGASTIGTAQLAYSFGFSAWWFTLGAGLGCVMLAAFYIKPIRKSGKDTVTQIIAEEYGKTAKALSGIALSMGIFLNIVAQVLAGVALLVSLSGISPFSAALLTIVCMGTFVLFGGVWGAGAAGTAKTVLLYLAVLSGGFVALFLAGGIRGLASAFPAFPWFSLLGRGAPVDLSAGFSLIVGVLSTQTYIQAAISGKDEKAAMRGAWASAVLIPPIGLAGIIIGLFMRTAHPALDPVTVFPQFVLMYLPPWLGGIVLAALFVAVLGTGAGLALGVGVILAKDLYAWLINPRASDKEILLASRVAIAGVMAAALFFISGNLKSLILQWSFLSMGLRGAAVFGVLAGALFLKGRVPRIFALCSIVAGPLAMLAWKFFLPGFLDPLLPGMTASLALLAAGLLYRVLFPKVPPPTVG